MARLCLRSCCGFVRLVGYRLSGALSLAAKVTTACPSGEGSIGRSSEILAALSFAVYFLSLAQNPLFLLLL